MSTTVDLQGQARRSRWALTAFVMLGAMSAAATTADLSRYRDFQLGTDLSTVAKQAGVSPSEAKVTQARPALIQELAWRPQSLGQSSQTETAREVLFNFYNGTLFRIVVNYDRYQTEGLTTSDLIDAISAAYGVAASPPATAKAAGGAFGDQEEALAEWQDSQYSFHLIRTSYGPSFKLVGIVKSLEEPVRAAAIEAARLDAKEAPQREAERIVRANETARAKLEKARLANKSKFRP